ncbi:MAG: hypothetical protein ACKOQ2_10905, partial [Dolichospermum sp.]
CQHPEKMDRTTSKLGDDDIPTFYLVRGQNHAQLMNAFDVEMMDNSQQNSISLQQCGALGVDHIPTSVIITTIIN